MKKIAGFLLFAVLACAVVGGVTGCKNTDKKDNGLSTNMHDFFGNERLRP